jgi:hypothetical protein
MRVLLQNTTTNAIESYHKDIKTNSSIGSGKSGFKQVLAALDMVFNKKIATYLLLY